MSIHEATTKTLSNIVNERKKTMPVWNYKCKYLEITYTYYYTKWITIQNIYYKLTEIVFSENYGYFSYCHKFIIMLMH